MQTQSHGSAATNAKFLSEFRKLSELSLAQGDKSTIQLSKDGLAVIHTRRHSKLAIFFARVFSRLSGRDFFDCYGIANKHRQKQAVDKFFEIMKEQNNYKDYEEELQNLSPIALQKILQESGANSIREWLSPREINDNKEISGMTENSMSKFTFTDINYDDLTIKTLLDEVVEFWRNVITEELRQQGFTDKKDIEHALTSMIEESEPLFKSIINSKDKAILYFEESEKLADKMAVFITMYTQTDSNIEETANEAMKLMVDFSNFTNLIDKEKLEDEWSPKIAKYALFPVIKAASKIRKLDMAKGQIAIGGGAELAAIVGQSFDKHHFSKMTSMDPMFSSCTNFEPIKATLKISGLMPGANSNYQNAIFHENTEFTNVQETCAHIVTKTIDEHGYQQFLTNSKVTDYIFSDFEDNQFQQVNFESFSGLQWKELTAEQKKRAVSICNDLRQLPRNFNSWTRDDLWRVEICPISEYLKSMRPLIAKFINNEVFADEYLKMGEDLQKNARTLSDICLKFRDSDPASFSEFAKAQTKLIQPLMFLSRSLGKDIDIELLSDLIAFKAAKTPSKGTALKMKISSIKPDTKLSYYLLCSRFAQNLIVSDPKMTPDQLEIDEDLYQEALKKNITQKFALFSVILSGQIERSSSGLSKFQNDRIWLKAGTLTKAEKASIGYNNRTEASKELNKFGKIINESIIAELRESGDLYFPPN